MSLVVELRGLGNRKIVAASELQHQDLKAANTKSAPDTVEPRQHRECSISGSRLQAKLRPLSWNVFVSEAA